jgi:WD40 repeat protein
MVFGTITGEICAIDIYQGESRDNTCEEGGDFEPVPIKSLGYYGKNKNDTMLGLCWLRPQASDIGVDCGSIYGESRGNNNLFLSGSSQGRVCLGNASREYDPTNRNSYSIVHDYPVFDRLTSVHVNCSNKLLLLSGYSPGVNVVDMETSQMVRKYDNIHKDHVNISRFSNLSPHLFATSSFDGTMKTWDLRQSSAGINSGTGLPEYRPVYSVNCNSGVVMINFSQDDNFILASALDNEINQFLFLDGRKHLTYNLPKTGLKSNFTRAYYSASGRHTLTGACEESTVKIMDTYTGEQVSTVELYPGKKDKSIYIQVSEKLLLVEPCHRDMSIRASHELHLSRGRRNSD